MSHFLQCLLALMETLCAAVACKPLRLRMAAGTVQLAKQPGIYEQKSPTKRVPAYTDVIIILLNFDLLLLSY
jgi:hypothetical protein